MSRLLRRLPAALACLMAIALPAGAIAASNLLVNPDFDDDIDPPLDGEPGGDLQPQL